MEVSRVPPVQLGQSIRLWLLLCAQELCHAETCLGLVGPLEGNCRQLCAFNLEEETPMGVMVKHLYNAHLKSKRIINIHAL